MTWESKQPQILSHPVRIRWAGWESDTYTLQQHGWEFAAHEDPMHRTLQLLLKNEQLQVQGKSECLNFEYLKYAHDPDHIRHIILSCHLASHYRVDENSFSRFRAIDCEPVYNDLYISEQRMINLKDLKVFRTVNSNIQKVYLEEPSMTEILNMALKKQAPRQEEIRRQLLKREHLEAISRNSELSAELRLVV